jgi:MFS family permease
MGLFTAGSPACALAQNIGWLIAVRAVQDAAAAVMLPLALALLSVGFRRSSAPRRCGSSGPSPASARVGRGRR